MYYFTAFVTTAHQIPRTPVLLRAPFFPFVDEAIEQGCSEGTQISSTELISRSNHWAPTMDMLPCVMQGFKENRAWPLPTPHRGLQSS
jgi:hypothetical protein